MPRPQKRYIPAKSDRSRTPNPLPQAIHMTAMSAKCGRTTDTRTIMRAPRRIWGGGWVGVALDIRWKLLSCNLLVEGESQEGRESTCNLQFMGKWSCVVGYPRTGHLMMKMLGKDASLDARSYMGAYQHRCGGGIASPLHHRGQD